MELVQKRQPAQLLKKEFCLPAEVLSYKEKGDAINYFLSLKEF